MPKKAEEKIKQAKKKVADAEEKTDKKTKKLSQKEFEKKVMELSKQGLTSEKIGEKLRLSGIHPKEHDKKISKILKENDSYEDSELKNVQNK